MTYEEEEIACAIHYIKKMYTRIYRSIPVITYRNNSVLYGLYELWATNKHRTAVLCRIVYKAIQRYPEASHYLVADLMHRIDKTSRVYPELGWMHGYFSRILDDNEYDMEIDLESSFGKLLLEEINDED